MNYNTTTYSAYEAHDILRFPDSAESSKADSRFRSRTLTKKLNTPVGVDNTHLTPRASTTTLGAVGKLRDIHSGTSQRSRATLSLERAVKTANYNDKFIQTFNASFSHLNQLRQKELLTKALLKHPNLPLNITSYPRYLGLANSESVSSSDDSAMSEGVNCQAASIEDGDCYAGHDSGTTRSTESLTARSDDSDDNERAWYDQTFEMVTFVRNIVSIGSTLVQNATEASQSKSEREHCSTRQLVTCEQLPFDNRQWADLYDDSSIPSIGAIQRRCGISEGYGSSQSYRKPSSESSASPHTGREKLSMNDKRSNIDCEIEQASDAQRMVDQSSPKMSLLQRPVANRQTRNPFSRSNVTLDQVTLRSLGPDAFVPPRKQHNYASRYRYKRKELTVVNKGDSSLISSRTVEGPGMRLTLMQSVLEDRILSAPFVASSDEGIAVVKDPRMRES